MNNPLLPLSYWGIQEANFMLLVGAFIGVAGSLLVFFLRLQVQKRRLRNALREEIRVMSGDIYRFSKVASRSDPEGIEVPPDTFVTTIYEANASQIGSLHSSEVEQITRFYTLTQNLKQRLSGIESSDDASLAQLRLIQRDLIRLNNQKNCSLSILEDNMWCVSRSTESNENIYSDISEKDYDITDYLDSQLDDEGSSEGNS